MLHNKNTIKVSKTESKSIILTLAHCVDLILCSISTADPYRLDANPSVDFPFNDFTNDLTF